MNVLSPIGMDQAVREVNHILSSPVRPTTVIASTSEHPSSVYKQIFGLKE